MIYGNLIDIHIEDSYRAYVDVTDHAPLSQTPLIWHLALKQGGSYEHLFHWVFLCSGTTLAFFKSCGIMPWDNDKFIIWVSGEVIISEASVTNFMYLLFADWIEFKWIFGHTFRSVELFYLINAVFPSTCRKTLHQVWCDSSKKNCWIYRLPLVYQRWFDFETNVTGRWFWFTWCSKILQCFPKFFWYIFLVFQFIFVIVFFGIFDQT